MNEPLLLNGHYLRLLPYQIIEGLEREPLVFVPEDLQGLFTPVEKILLINGEERVFQGVWPDTLISASSLNTFDACNRSWGWDKLDKVPRIETASQKRGKEHHSELENWGRKAIYPGADFDRLLPALEYFPEPLQGLQEQYFALLVDDVVFHGFLDWETDEAVFDLKTTKDLSWAKSPKELSSDTQSSIYALKKLVETRRESVKCRWVYTQMVNRRMAYPVETTFTRESALENVVTFLPSARAMVEYKRNPPPKKALDLAPDWSHCGAYGGCPYAKLCVVSSKNHFLSLMKQDKTKNTRKEMGLSLKEKIAADLAKKGKEMPPPAASLPVQKPAASAAPKVTTVASTPKAAVPAVTTSAPAAAPKTPATPVPGAKKTSLVAGAKSVDAAKTAPMTVPVKSVNPPDASPDPRVKTAPAEAETATTPAPAVEKKVSAPPTAPKPASAPTKSAPVPNSASGLGFCLLVDCLPTKGGVESIDSILRPLQVDLEKACSVAHYKLIDFNKGPAMLASGLRDRLQTKPNGMFALDSRTIDSEVLAVLLECADQVIRGVR